MERLPSFVYSLAAVRAAEQQARVACGLTGQTLMRRAAGAAFESVRANWPRVARLLVLCGPGDNGGDGYALAALAKAAGYHVVVVAPVGLPDDGDAAQFASDWQAAGGVLTDWHHVRLDQSELVIDALLGTGLSRPVTGVLASIIEAVNRAPVPVLSLDIPSGLSGEDGRVLGVAIEASVTLTFVALKPGLFLGDGLEKTGRLEAHALDLPDDVLAGHVPVMRRLTDAVLTNALPQRPRTQHKGLSGRVLIIGGGVGLLGAVRLAGEAALGVGAGLVQIATAPGQAVALAAACPDLMVSEVHGPEDLGDLLAAADVVAIGPGLGRTAWAESLWQAVCRCDQPLVVDADALNLLARQPVRRSNWCLTPHPGEAGRLLGIPTSAVQADRLAALASLEARYDAAVVLKGAGTLVRHAGGPSVCDRGNPGMAVGGMGDALTGVIAGIAAQRRCVVPGVDAWSVACAAGVYLHVVAGDRAASRGQRVVRPGDLIRMLSTW